MITDIEDFFSSGCGRCARVATADCSTRLWAGGLQDRRLICLSTGLSEPVKWGHPCYMHAGRNIAIIGAFRGDFRLSFFNAALMQDPEGVLERQGPNTRHPDAIRFADNAQPAAMKPVILSYLRQAMDYADAGVLPPKGGQVVGHFYCGLFAAKGASEVELPDELPEAVQSDPELAGAFHALTPGRQKSYAISLRAARKPETRVARIARFRDRIIAGKGANDR